MEAQYIADRSLLCALWHQHPDWSNADLAQATGRSLAWVKKWKARFRAEPNPLGVIWGRSRAHPPRAQFTAAVIEQILSIRDEPPQQLHRTPGPRAILYYLSSSPGLDGERLPRSTRTIWKILRAGDRIAQRRPRQHCPQDPPEPLVELQLDFKDLVELDPVATSKQAHAIEVFDAVDAGTSLWLMGEPSAAYTAETVFAPLLHLLEQIGLPERVRFDRDPRFLGSASMRDFPSPFVRFWYALGVQPVVNPPHRPDLNAFVERLHRTLEEEYRRIESPHSLETALQTLPLFHLHYNQERPHQGRSCGNRPPAVAYPQLPQRPLLPERVDPDRWLEAYDERCFARRVKPNGMVVLDGQSYYVGSRYAGEEIVAQLDASARQIRFVHQRVVVKRCALKGLVNQQLLLSQFVAWCEREARALWRRSLYAHSVGRAS